MTYQGLGGLLGELGREFAGGPVGAVLTRRDGPGVDGLSDGRGHARFLAGQRCGLCHGVSLPQPSAGPHALWAPRKGTRSLVVSASSTSSLEGVRLRALIRSSSMVSWTMVGVSCPCLCRRSWSRSLAEQRQCPRNGGVASGLNSMSCNGWLTDG